ncbi:uncharacterized protein A1O9_00417 [Exophiala aquamarina CBS 119918]|uniref:N-acetyltransferase domain-containing protein n=1 Tax=Exophiala aquamarina CBS 119918 TaxID=1182545 RepID=A0A072Q3G3_9EURO|nr:uncharacterized protein A1O9_00417 [Exophiala aquamarina CBS 119918]KEF62445.1 hypothetical protein A1O9_00417 [Exophiala aquamarina CBS 119918]
MTVAAPSFTIHKLDSTALASNLEPVLNLSNLIFDTQSSRPTHHSSLEEWSIRLSRPDSILVYSTSSSSQYSPPRLSTSISTDPAPVVLGFVFAHMKSDRTLPHPTLHIWLAGVSEDTRGTGVFAALMSKVEDHARSLSIGALSVATFPAKYEKMYTILQKQGWEEREWTERGRKVLMMKPI